MFATPQLAQASPVNDQDLGNPAAAAQGDVQANTSSGQAGASAAAGQGEQSMTPQNQQGQAANGDKKQQPDGAQPAPSGQGSSAQQGAGVDGDQQHSAPQSNAQAVPQAQAEPQGDIDHKPAMTQMLSYNNRVDATIDELRMDFVLRVAHGDVDPNCVPLAGGNNSTGRDGWGQCGLQLFYSYDLNGSKLRRLSYMNTLGRPSDSQGDKQIAASQWAQNMYSYFTIHNVKTSADGKYDYLSISAEGDVDYPNNPQHGQALGGQRFEQQVEAVVRPNTVSVPRGGDCGNAKNPCYINLRNTNFDSKYSTNIAKGYPIYLYDHTCSSGRVAGWCAGPVAFVGYDNTPKLFGGGQSNWGLPVDNGFSGRGEAPGVAPQNSFFAYWGNSANTQIQNPCSNTSTFYYEWMGLKNGKWVPVTSLNKKALASNGQWQGTNPGTVSTPAYNGVNPSNKEQTIMGDGDAQQPNGAIDFAKAKAEQGLDGYFKLVSWPTSTNQDGSLTTCVADNKAGENNLSIHTVYNPLYGHEDGITEQMANSDPAQAQKLMDMGWTIDTAFDGFDYTEGVTTNPPTSLPNADPVNAPSPSLPANSMGHQPKIEKMLAYNSKIDTAVDELRADFVLRVGHGDVNPSCIGLAGGKHPGPNFDGPGPNNGRDGVGNCGLQLFYSYDSKGYKMRRASYINTYKSDNLGSNSPENLKDSALWWARNMYSMYTIHDIQSAGDYDYLTISMEGDLDYPNNVNPNVLNGEQYPLHIYAVVNNHGSAPAVNVSSCSDSNGTFENACYVCLPKNMYHSPYMADITQNYPVRLYDNSRCSANSGPDHCNGPVSFVGYDNMLKLWSNAQANWGLVADNGFGGRSEAPGVAPARSFFTNWFNRSQGRRWACAQVNNYYYQWIGMAKGGGWVPVKALTPKAQITSSKPSGDWSGWNGISNEPGGLMSAGDAQNPDGSIDFAKAKAEQPELNGYFKLVTWPVSTNVDGSMSGCSTGATQSIYNPLLNNQDGITSDLAVHNQSKTEELINEGWAIDTAFEGYSYGNSVQNLSKVSINNVDVPHTVKPDGTLPQGSAIKVSGSVDEVNYGNSTLKVYAVFKDPSKNPADLNPTDEASLVYQTTVSQVGNVPYSFSVQPGYFTKYLSQGDDFRFTAVLTDSNGLQAQPAQLDHEVDVTPPQTSITKLDLDTTEGKLDPVDSHKDLSRTSVVVTWPDGSTSNAQVKANGDWSVATKNGVGPGTVKVDATDESGNQAKTVSKQLLMEQHQLPMTGFAGWGFVLLVLALALIAYIIGHWLYKNHSGPTEKARHGIR